MCGKRRRGIKDSGGRADVYTHLLYSTHCITVGFTVKFEGGECGAVEVECWGCGGGGEMGM